MRRVYIEDENTREEMEHGDFEDDIEMSETPFRESKRARVD